jgi:tetratricopeptide (TPR) repeat protein
MLDRLARRRPWIGVLPVLLLWGATESVQVSHLLFGDINIGGMPSTTVIPQTFIVILKASTGRIFGRDAVPPNGRFRFNNVPNGEYELVIELGNRQIHTERLFIYEFKPSEVRHDLDFQWTEPADQLAAEGSPPVVYARSHRAQERLVDAQRLHSEGDHLGAVAVLRGVVESDPNDYEAWTELGTACFLGGLRSEAAEAYERALGRRSDFLPALINFGKLRLDAREHREAIELLEKAVALAPQRAESHRLLGESYLGVRMGSKASVALNRAIALDPEGMAEAHLRLGQLYGAAGYPKLAADEYEKFLQKRPDSPLRSELREYIRSHQ